MYINARTSRTTFKSLNVVISPACRAQLLRSNLSLRHCSSTKTNDRLLEERSIRERQADDCSQSLDFAASARRAAAQS